MGKPGPSKRPSLSSSRIRCAREAKGDDPTSDALPTLARSVTISSCGGFSRVEQTLLEGGRGSAVIQQRMEFQELMRARFEAA